MTDLANIISIGTAVPAYRHQQSDILQFMQQAYQLDGAEARKLGFLYRQSEINTRYSVLEDFGLPKEAWNFLSSNTQSPSVGNRMALFDQYAASLSIQAIHNAIKDNIEPEQITHLITVSCTGISAPGLDLQIAEALELRSSVFRTSVNFMGCYAAIHALKIGKMICDTDRDAQVVIVCTELCTLHFQNEYSADNAASSLLFGDGSAAVLLSGNTHKTGSLQLSSFYSEVAYRGKNEMSWQVSDKGFLMKLSTYVPHLIQEDIAHLVQQALNKSQLSPNDITHWCMHPGGKKILEVIQSALHLSPTDMSCSKKVLSNYGNMSSPTILFVLKEIIDNLNSEPAVVFGVAFGPGLTMETFIARSY